MSKKTNQLNTNLTSRDDIQSTLLSCCGHLLILIKLEKSRLKSKRILTNKKRLKEIYNMINEIDSMNCDVESFNNKINYQQLVRVSLLLDEAEILTNREIRKQDKYTEKELNNGSHHNIVLLAESALNMMIDVSKGLIHAKKLFKKRATKLAYIK